MASFCDSEKSLNRLIVFRKVRFSFTCLVVTSWKTFLKVHRSIAQK